MKFVKHYNKHQQHYVLTNAQSSTVKQFVTNDASQEQEV